MHVIKLTKLCVSLALVEFALYSIKCAQALLSVGFAFLLALKHRDAVEGGSVVYFYFRPTSTFFSEDALGNVIAIRVASRSEHELDFTQERLEFEWPR